MASTFVNAPGNLIIVNGFGFPKAGTVMSIFDLDLSCDSLVIDCIVSLWDWQNM